MYIYDCESVDNYKFFFLLLFYWEFLWKEGRGWSEGDAFNILFKLVDLVSINVWRVELNLKFKESTIYFVTTWAWYFAIIPLSALFLIRWRVFSSIIDLSSLSSYSDSRST